MSLACVNHRHYFMHLTINPLKKKKKQTYVKDIASIRASSPMTDVYFSSSPSPQLTHSGLFDFDLSRFSRKLIAQSHNEICNPYLMQLLTFQSQRLLKGMSRVQYKLIQNQVKLCRKLSDTTEYYFKSLC